MSKRILILCTGNSCRSQMAEGYLASLDENLEVYSAGTGPAPEIHPLAAEAMAEIGIDLGNNYPKHVDQFRDMSFDYVITVCDSAMENCPVFTGDVKTQLHLGFYDPAVYRGTPENTRKKFREIRDQIRVTFKKFYEDNLTGEA